MQSKNRQPEDRRIIEKVVELKEKTTPTDVFPERPIKSTAPKPGIPPRSRTTTKKNHQESAKQRKEKQRKSIDSLSEAEGRLRVTLTDGESNRKAVIHTENNDDNVEHAKAKENNDDDDEEAIIEEVYYRDDEPCYDSS